MASAGVRYWPGVVLGQVVKSRRGRRLSAVERRVVERPSVFAPSWQSPAQDRAQAVGLIRGSQGGSGMINTSYIERLNATFRSRLSSLVRRSRSLVCDGRRLEHSMYLVGCVYNVCLDHESVSLPLVVSTGYSERVRRVRRTPAMAASLTDHRWSVHELLSYRTGLNMPLHG